MNEAPVITGTGEVAAIASGFGGPEARLAAHAYASLTTSFR